MKYNSGMNFEVPWMIIVLIIVQNQQGVDSFTPTLQPENVTANYGEFVEFMCGFSFTDRSPHILEIYFGSSGRLRAFPDQFDALNQHEYYVNIRNNTNETIIGVAGILINTKTIQVIEYFRCKLIHGSESVFSSPAYIVDIHYPECSAQPPSTLHPTPSQTMDQVISTGPTSTTTALEQSCTAINGTERATINTLSTYVIIGVCIISVITMMCILILTCVCVHNKRFLAIATKLKSSSLRTHQVTRSMVQNPIYDGPVYESILTRFDSPTTQTMAADNSGAKYPLSAIPASVENVKNRYISQPGISDSGTNESRLTCITNEHTEEHNGEHLTPGTSSNGCVMAKE